MIIPDGMIIWEHQNTPSRKQPFTKSRYVACGKFKNRRRCILLSILLGGRYVDDIMYINLSLFESESNSVLCSLLSASTPLSLCCEVRTTY